LVDAALAESRWILKPSAAMRIIKARSRTLSKSQVLSERP
jgi:hypothetical protein